MSYPLVNSLYPFVANNKHNNEILKQYSNPNNVFIFNDKEFAGELLNVLKQLDVSEEITPGSDISLRGSDSEIIILKSGGILEIAKK